jgi:hypothetical protein
MFIRSTNSIYQIVEQLPDLGRNVFFLLLVVEFPLFVILGWRYNKSYFLATKTGSPKDDRYLLSWVVIGILIHIYFSIYF